MKKSDDIQLLREYLKEAILLEYSPSDNPSYGATKLGNVFKAAGKQLKTGAEAMKGDIAKGVARTARGVSQIFGNVIQVATLGMYNHQPVQEKINAAYSQILGKINSQYGGAKKELDATFEKSMSPILKAGIVYDPVTTLTMLAAKKGLSKLDDAVTKMELKSGASSDFKNAIDGAYEKIQRESKKLQAEKQLEMSQKSSVSEKTIKKTQALKKVKDRLEQEFQEMKDLGMSNTPLGEKHLETLNMLRSIKDE